MFSRPQQDRVQLSSLQATKIGFNYAPVSIYIYIYYAAGSGVAAACFGGLSLSDSVSLSYGLSSAFCVFAVLIFRIFCVFRVFCIFRPQTFSDRYFLWGRRDNPHFLHFRLGLPDLQNAENPTDRPYLDQLYPKYLLRPFLVSKVIFISKVIFEFARKIPFKTRFKITS